MRRLLAIAILALLVGCGDGGGGAGPAPTPPLAPGATRLSLDGRWRFRTDPDDVGLAQRWFDPATLAGDWRDAPVPGNWNFLFRDSPYPETDHDYEGVAWYRRRVAVPADFGTPLTALHFEAVHYRATVWVNGVEVGDHEGDFVPFELDVTAALRPGATNDIAVRVESLTAGSQNTIPPARGRYDYWIYPGIHRSVWLESAGGLYDLFVHAEPNADGTAVADATITLLNPDRRDRVAAVLFEVRRVGDDSRPEGVISSTLAPAMSWVTLRLSPSITRAPQPWSPARPILYEARSRVFFTDEPGVLAPGAVVTPYDPAQPLPPRATLAFDDGALTARFGIRRVETDGERILLNGEPIVFKGVNRHDEYPLLGRVLPDDLYESDLEAMKAVGINAIRTAHYPNDPRLYDLADRMGFLVIEEAPVTGLERADFANPRIRQLAREQAVAMVRRDRNHPSIVIWSVGNEPFPTGSADFNSRLYEAVRVEDPTRLVSYARGQIDNVNPDPDSDLIMLNPYWGWYTGAIDGLDRFLEQTRQKFPGKPIILTEFGADAVPGRRTNADPATSPHFSEDFQAYYLSETWRIVRSKPWVSGGFVWAFADFLSPTRKYLRSLQFAPPSSLNPVPFHNLKGILTNDRRPKNAYLTVRGMYGDEAPVDLAFEVVDTAGAGVAGAEVILRGPGGERPLAAGSTDAQGRLVLWRIPAGSYRVEVTNGRAGSTRSIDVESSQTVRMEIDPSS